MADFPIQSGSPGGAPAFSAVSDDGDTYPNDGQTFMLIGGAAGKTLTVSSPHGGHEDYSIDLLGSSVMMPRFDPTWWNDRTGRVAFSFDDIVGVQVAVIRMGVVGSDPNAAPLPSLF